MDDYVFVIIMTILAFPMFALVGNYVTKIVKAKNGGEGNKALEAQVQQLLEENKALHKRLNNVETIVLEDKEYYELPPRNEPKTIAGQLHDIAEKKRLT